ncbi:hypothetical protein [Corynebacterium halotolerans]|uniref:SWIM-type domain-containing protein n=1 Tax=Corynebacterium halotolerans YIM 70093 = DSM 44683 TaxID=1121362 RepID=M1NRQ2_9CORY|nr:hypothetical protein [Corynebacterium halotolerans]AGF72187.1 hypothetical protein A605_05905 [Corynebacterium halotolerans YIM 70093 = DSM 44683]
MAESDRPGKQGRQRPKDGNVIYANFGNRTRVTGSDDAPRAPRRTRPAFVPGAARLLDAVTRLTDQGRVTRGRQYAAAGHVVGLEVANGRVHGQVAGSQNEPFNVAIQLPYRSTDDIAKVTDRLARTTNGLRRARSGDVADELLDILLAEDPSDIRFSCDCPDSAVVCKHAVAVVEKLAAKMDADSALLFQLRGLDLGRLEQAVSEQAKIVSRESEDDTELFWSGHPLPDLPDPKVAPALDDSDLDLLHKAMRAVSYTSIDQLRAVSDIEDIYDHLTR